MAENYTEKYKEDLFYAWYETGDKSFGTSLLDKIPANENGSKPNLISIKKWSEENGWIERADALDAQVSVAQDNLVINRRIAMYEKHEEVGEELITMGRDFLKKLGEGGGLKTENAAIRAIELGMETERKSVGVADYVRRLSDMTPDQLDMELQKLLGQKKDDEFIIDGETKEMEPKE